MSRRITVCRTLILLPLILTLTNCAITPARYPTYSIGSSYRDNGPPPLLGPQLRRDLRDAIGYQRWLQQRTTYYGWGAKFLNAPRTHRQSPAPARSGPTRSRTPSLPRGRTR